jgi:hypothetical protein
MEKRKSLWNKPAPAHHFMYHESHIKSGQVVPVQRGEKMTSKMTTTRANTSLHNQL